MEVWLKDLGALTLADVNTGFKKAENQPEGSKNAGDQETKTGEKTKTGEEIKTGVEIKIGEEIKTGEETEDSQEPDAYYLFVQLKTISDLVKTIGRVQVTLDPPERFMEAPIAITAGVITILQEWAEAAPTERLRRYWEFLIETHFRFVEKCGREACDRQEGRDGQKARSGRETRDGQET
ncbi:MAG: hypothetical protein Q9181_007446 [Wetmoreana brouardii]